MTSKPHVDTFPSRAGTCLHGKAIVLHLFSNHNLTTVLIFIIFLTLDQDGKQVRMAEWSKALRSDQDGEVIVYYQLLFTFGFTTGTALSNTTKALPSCGSCK